MKVKKVRILFGQVKDADCRPPVLIRTSNEKGYEITLEVLESLRSNKRFTSISHAKMNRYMPAKELKISNILSKCEIKK